MRKERNEKTKERINCIRIKEKQEQYVMTENIERKERKTQNLTDHI